jgi:hypothetical protein
VARAIITAMESKKEKILWQSLKILKQTTRQQRHRHSCDCASVLQIPILVSLGIQSFPLVLGNILDDVLGDLQNATKREQEKASLRDEQSKRTSLFTALSSSRMCWVKSCAPKGC